MRERDHGYLNRAIARLLGWKVYWSEEEGHWWIGGENCDGYVPDYSRSLDDCVAACIEAGLRYGLDNENGFCAAEIYSVNEVGGLDTRLGDATASVGEDALALSLALRAALEAKTEGGA